MDYKWDCINHIGWHFVQCVDGAKAPGMWASWKHNTISIQWMLWNREWVQWIQMDCVIECKTLALHNTMQCKAIQNTKRCNKSDVNSLKAPHPFDISCICCTKWGSQFRWKMQHIRRVLKSKSHPITEPYYMLSRSFRCVIKIGRIPITHSGIGLGI